MATTVKLQKAHINRLKAITWPQMTCNMSHMLLLQCFWPVVNHVLPRGPDISLGERSQHYPLNKQSQELWAPHLTEQVLLQLLTGKKVESWTSEMEWNRPPVSHSVEFWPGNLGEANQPPRRLARYLPHKRTCVFTLCSTSPLDYYYPQHTMSASLVMLLCLWVCCQGVRRSWAIRKALYLPWLKRKQVIRK